ncbi:MAG: restriction endonuclease subunit S [Deltaproteobacteria bacterium]|nr:restriction endonuclease subunit S [Deltaproteobacteria bacterium]
MIADLKPYPEYRETEQFWLGAVPSHWEVLPNRAIFSEVKDRNHPDEEMLSVTINRGVIRQKALLENSSKKDSSNKDKSAYKLLCPGDIAYNKMRAWQCAIGASDLRGIISPAYVVMRLRNDDHNHQYFHHLYRTPQFGKEAERWSYGITSDMWSLRPEHFKIINTPLPPPDEQTSIVRFLNHTNQRIERTIRAKRKVIALLNEQKQVFIHHAATRGLDPNVRLKPSGIPWFGSVPEHWEIVFLRMRYSVELGKMLDVKKITGRNLIPYLRNRDVQWDRIVVDDLPVMDISNKEYARYTVKRGDLLVCEGGQVGRAAFWKEQLPICGFQKALHRIRAIDSNRDFPRFLFYITNYVATRGVFAADGNENTIAHLTCEKLRRYRFPFPPFDEQYNISNFLDNELLQFQNVISRTEREIDLLREYRTRLIADVVTGKLDVREAAARLPDEVDEIEEVILDDDDVTGEEVADVE